MRISAGQRSPPGEPRALAGDAAYNSSCDHPSPVRHAFLRAPLSPRLDRLVRIGINLLAAAGAALFARASVLYYLETHRVIGGLFVIEQTWLVVAFLIRRSERAVSRRFTTWLVAFGAACALLLRPDGAHPAWGATAGFALQLIGLVICIVSLLALGRSFGYVAADRGLKTWGPYAVVRHPVYASYVLMQSGYVLQAISIRNILILLAATGCNAGRALAEERLLSRSAAYPAYKLRVRWRMIPYLW
jgi:protein-S-isoprenylcysteine O-methyltransferase Ste14